MVRRAQGAVPIIVVSARGEIGDRLGSLDSGADDYLVKPFDLDELLRELRAVTRRGSLQKKELLAFAGVAFDQRNRQATIDGQRISLRPREAALLEVMLRRAGEPVHREMLLSGIYGWTMKSGRMPSTCMSITCVAGWQRPAPASQSRRCAATAICSRPQRLRAPLTSLTFSVGRDFLIAFVAGVVAALVVLSTQIESGLFFDRGARGVADCRVGDRLAAAAADRRHRDDRQHDRTKHARPAAPGTRLADSRCCRSFAASTAPFERLEQAASASASSLRRAAHQLRTPMTVLSARAQALDDSATAAELRDDIKQLSRIVGQCCNSTRSTPCPIAARRWPISARSVRQ